MQVKKLYIFIPTLIFLLLLSCQKEEIEQPFPDSDFILTGECKGEYWPTDEWRSCAPEDVGMNASLLQKMNEDFVLQRKLHHEVHSVLVIRYLSATKNLQSAL